MKTGSLTRRRHDEAAAAWVKAREDKGQALRWLMRAARLAPDDPRIALELAQAQLQSGEAAAAAAGFARLSKEHDIAAIWMGLALASLQTGDGPQAVAALEAMLQRHCLPDDPGFSNFALLVATANGHGGFQAVRPDGSLVLRGAGHLLGARPNHGALTRVEGLVTWEKNGLSGWAAHAAAPEAPPDLWLQDTHGARRKVKLGKILPPDSAAPFLPRYKFRLGPVQLRGLTPPFHLGGASGPEISGSPVQPEALQQNLQQNPRPAKRRGKPPARTPRRAKLALLMPVYRGLAQTKAALTSTLAAAPAGTKIIVVDDCTPEPALARWLDRLAASGRIILHRHERNLGFCAAVNHGIALAKNHDVLLLNADILLPRGVIEALREVAYADKATGTVTPFSNEATLCSYPSRKGGNPMPDARQTARLNALARQANGLEAVEIPTAVGFCMFIRHDCLRATGKLRGEIFAQGYGEENDFCLRARHLGFRHMAAPGAFVAHQGGVSFRAAARGLMIRNLRILNDLFPGYLALVQAHEAANPLAPYRARLDTAQLLAQRARKGAVLLISHGHGGGVARQVQADMARWRAEGFLPLLLSTQFPENPDKTPYPWPAQLGMGEKNTCPNLTFTLPGTLPNLLALLRQLSVRRVVLHHGLGHHESVRGLAAMLGVPQDIVVHDYASFCPRVNLLNRPDKTAPLRYCGEPALAGCITCCKIRDGGVRETLPVAQLRARSAAEFAAAERVIVPSADAARRLQRHFPGLKPVITPWEDDSSLPPPILVQRHAAPRRVAVIGGIGPSKGFDVLLECATDAKARNLPLEFIVIGNSADDEKLLAAGIFVTGAYREGEATALIEYFKPSIAFLPSIWPETWCFALSEAWRAGLRAVVFGLGAQGERMHATGRGTSLPLGLPPQRINELLCRLP